MFNAKSPRTDPAEPGAAGALPGSSRLNSKKFRPSRGRPAICEFSITLPSASESRLSHPRLSRTTTSSVSSPGCSVTRISNRSLTRRENFSTCFR